MANEVAGIDIVARLDAFRSELAKIPDIGAGEAKALTAKLEKEIKKAEKAAREAAKAAKDNAAATGDMADSIDDAGRAATKARGALSQLSKGAAEQAGFVDDASDAYEGFTLAVESLGPAAAALGISMESLVAVLGPVAVAVGIAAVAYKKFAADLAEAEAKVKTAAEGAERMSRAHEGMAKVFAESDEAFGQAVGTVDELADDYRKSDETIRAASAGIRKELEAQKEAHKQAADALDVQVKAQARIVASMNDGSESAKHEAQVLASLEDKFITQAALVADADRKLGGLTQREEEYVAQGRSTIAILDARKKAEEAAAAAKTAAAKAASAAAAAERELAEATKDTAAALSEDSSDKATEAYLKRVAALEKLVTETRALSDTEIEAIERKAKAMSGGVGGLASADPEAAAEAEVAIEEWKQGEIEKLRATAVKNEADRLAEIQSMHQAGASAIADAAAGIGEQVKEAGMAGFLAWQATALADIAVSTIVAAQRAVAELGPIAGPIAAGVIAAGGAIAAGKVATETPSFDDTPGVMQARGGRTNVSLKDGDFFAAAQNPSDLKAQVGGSQVLEVRMGHRTLDRTVAKVIAQGGRLQRTIAGLTQTTPTGHRAR